MKTLGLISGLSWFSLVVYYKTINQLINKRIGNSHSAIMLLYPMDFDEFDTLQKKGDWEQIEIMITAIALRPENAGADCVVICTNIPHFVADKISKKIKIPLINIAEEATKKILSQKVDKVGLLATNFTMENTFYKDRLKKFGIELVIPDRVDQDFIQTVIFTELTKGIFTDKSKKRFLEIIENLKKKGAQGVIFGCTEISLLITQNDCDVTIFDTIAVHAVAPVNFSLH